MREWPSIVPAASEDYYIVVNHILAGSVTSRYRLRWMARRAQQTTQHPAPADLHCSEAPNPRQPIATMVLISPSFRSHWRLKASVWPAIAPNVCVIHGGGMARSPLRARRANSLRAQQLHGGQHRQSAVQSRLPEPRARGTLYGHQFLFHAPFRHAARTRSCDRLYFIYNERYSLRRAELASFDNATHLPYRLHDRALQRVSGSCARMGLSVVCGYPRRSNRLWLLHVRAMSGDRVRHRWLLSK